ncbi:hypothetical protein [Virgibacillus litoralis]|uniref:DUF4944 domain-containing protein n=1 Tax=Virgibacillus litoralis TaxID=578221 RepID=A0ABS4HDQ4_9BACI|nr:hypothetical protein [Virgibacillus litoralis]MBP1948988.1 hypothetical protein [Virgibacillus litoralis]
MNRNKLIIGIVGLVILLIATTSVMKSLNKEVIEHNYTFVGESENWKAEYRVKGQEVFYEENDTFEYDSESKSQLKLTYKGDLNELSLVRSLEFNYEAPLNGGGKGLEFDKPPEQKVFTHSSNDLVSEDAVIDVNVQWDENKEEFTLKSKEQP